MFLWVIHQAPLLVLTQQEVLPKHIKDELEEHLVDDVEELEVERGEVDQAKALSEQFLNGLLLDGFQIDLSSVVLV